MPLRKVVLDACVLFPWALRDILLRAADTELYKLCLTDQILEEMRRNLVQKGHITEKQGQSLVRQMKWYFNDAFDTEYTSIVSDMPINDKDRHVLAAAVASKSQIIVTQNLKDFPRELLKPFGIEALSPDDFLMLQFSEEQEAVITILRDHISDLKKPPLTTEEALTKLENLIPRFIRLIRNEL
jgi:predicted nucleic acid-binding protein